MSNQSKQSATELLSLSLTIWFGYCAIIFGAQVFHFLKSGDWVQAPAINLFLSSNSPDANIGPNALYPSGLADGTWLASPQGWAGLWMIIVWVLMHTHVSIALFVIGLLAFTLSLLAFDYAEREIKSYRDRSKLGA